MIKSGDGTGTWSQFNPSVVSALHRSGLRVCAWQYVYGDHPITEAYVGAAAVRDGADCLIIDAEAQYEGKYVSAQAYMTRLRKLVGNSYPIALAGFPYVDYHPAFPYSVFLGPGGAQHNAPQMYWADIGTTVDAVYAHTYGFNRVYQRPIYPLGQAFDHPRAGQIKRFRQMSRSYGSANVSWWDWQEATGGDWLALSQPIGALHGFAPNTTYATLGIHASGDVVVWAQEHLVSAGQRLAIDGSFGPATFKAVEGFQAATASRRRPDRPGHVECPAALFPGARALGPPRAPDRRVALARRDADAAGPEVGQASRQAQRDPWLGRRRLASALEQIVLARVARPGRPA